MYIVSINRKPVKTCDELDEARNWADENAKSGHVQIFNEDGDLEESWKVV